MTEPPDREWKYVDVRRFLIFIEQSLDRGMRWVVFEPNTEPTWAGVREQVREFLCGLFESGVLAGDTPDDAFSVRCGLDTMTQDDLDSGRLVCEVGVGPLQPAEFVIFRIGQWTQRNC